MSQITGDQYQRIVDRLTALERKVAELQGKPVPKPLFEAMKAPRHELGCICAECEREIQEHGERRAELIRRRT
jgi:hypothetical protein